MTQPISQIVAETREAAERAAPGSYLADSPIRPANVLRIIDALKEAQEANSDLAAEHKVMLDMTGSLQGGIAALRAALSALVKERDEAREQADELEDASEDVVMAYGMGFDLEGVISVLATKADIEFKPRSEAQSVSDLINALTARCDALTAALEWYAEHVGSCRKNTSEGDEARRALDRDCGERARSSLAQIKAALGETG